METPNNHNPVPISREEVLQARKERKQNQKKRKRVDFDETGQRPLPHPSHCSYWLAKKRRYCGLSRYPGAEYCTDHLASVNGYKRIPCPNDPRHTIYENDLENHVKFRCPALNKIGGDKPWFALDINSGPEENEQDSELYRQHKHIQTMTDTEGESQFVAVKQYVLKRDQDRTTFLSTMDPEVLYQLINKLEALWTKYEPEITSELIVNDYAGLVDLPENSSQKKVKHAIQNAAIMKHLQHAHLWDSQRIYLEWGSGNAALSQLIQSLLHSDHILIDRQTPKSRSDGKRDRSKIWKRLTIDIKDLNLDKVEELNSIGCASPIPPTSSQTNTENIPSNHQSNGLLNRRICSFSKHLCGAATDLTLRCCFQTHRNQNAPIDSIVIALCCHHQCSWRSYVGRHFFEDTLGLTRHDFELMIRMTSWATSAEHGEVAANLPGNMSTEDKAKWGWRCKRMLDLGRVDYLKSHGFQTQFKYYVPTSISLENILLVSKKSES